MVFTRRVGDDLCDDLVELEEVAGSEKELGSSLKEGCCCCGSNARAGSSNEDK